MCAVHAWRVWERDGGGTKGAGVEADARCSPETLENKRRAEGREKKKIAGGRNWHWDRISSQHIHQKRC